MECFKVFLHSKVCSSNVELRETHPKVYTPLCDMHWKIFQEITALLEAGYEHAAIMTMTDAEREAAYNSL